VSWGRSRWSGQPEFVVVTHWDSVAALEAFAGPRWTGPRDDLTHHRLGFGQGDAAIEMDMSRHSMGSPLAAAPSTPQAAITALVVWPYRRSLHRTPRSGAASIAPGTACHDVPNGGAARHVRDLAR